MIDIHGLQVGNWLEHKFSFKNYQIEGIHDNLIYIKEVTPGWVHMSAYSPIPLTPEILIACGFKKRTYNDEYLFEEHSQMWFKYYSHLGAWQLEVDTSYEGGYETDIATIKSLHQLQNLYYCLTGEELNYKPLNHQSRTAVKAEDWDLIKNFAKYFWCYETGGDWQGTDKQFNMIVDHFCADRDNPIQSQPTAGGVKNEIFEQWLLKNAWRRLDDDKYAHKYKTWGGFPVYKKTKDLFAEYLKSQPTAGEYYAKDQMLVAFAMGYERKSKELDWSYFKPTAGGVKEERWDDKTQLYGLLQIIKDDPCYLHLDGRIQKTIESIGNHVVKKYEMGKDSQIPRRIRLDLSEPAELAIRNAVDEVEKIGADVRLTNAINLLNEARELVADYIDKVPLKSQPSPSNDGGVKEEEIPTDVTRKMMFEYRREIKQLKYDIESYKQRLEAQPSPSNPSIKRPTEEEIKKALSNWILESVHPSDGPASAIAWWAAINWLLSIQPDK